MARQAASGVQSKVSFSNTRMGPVWSAGTRSTTDRRGTRIRLLTEWGVAIRFWLGVAQRDSVLRSVHRGLAQVSSGARESLETMNESDGLVYYSPRAAFEGEVLREFTAIGRIAPGPTFQNGDSSSAYNPWRRRADYDPDAVAASIRPLLAILDLTRGNPDWGYQLRRGLLEISRHDFEVIRQQMRRPSPDDR